MSDGTLWRYFENDTQPVGSTIDRGTEEVAASWVENKGSLGKGSVPLAGETVKHAKGPLPI